MRQFAALTFRKTLIFNHIHFTPQNAIFFHPKEKISIFASPTPALVVEW
jgi:hypothetical protein